MPFVGVFNSQVVGITESAEQSLAMPTTGGASLNPGTAGLEYGDTIAFTNPNGYDYVKITAIQWKNGATVNGNVTAFVYIVDLTSPSSATKELVAITASTAQAGTSTTQKANVLWSKTFSGTPNLFLGVMTSSTTSTFSLLAGQPAKNTLITGTYATGFPTIDSTAWTSSTTYLADATLFYKGYK